MMTKFDGLTYTEMLDAGIKSLNKHRDILNDLNVFPVPDGDTGTNMVMTLRYAYGFTQNKNMTLQDAAQSFSTAAVFGARGNSGVIISQFFKGISEVLKKYDEADSAILSEAIDSGCLHAYSSVAKPVEGTMLTVMKDGAAALRDALPLASVDEAVDVFLQAARVSLENTPSLLPILKKAGVVDSGGSGVVYFFEGVQSMLRGEEIDATEPEMQGAPIDLSMFNKDTSFDYGYCIEGLIQLRSEPEQFNTAAFIGDLSRLGTSVVTSLELDKVKIHIHSKKPGKVMSYCQTYGEFLTVKIENMTVQNMQSSAGHDEEDDVKKYLYDKDRAYTDFAIVAVATNAAMQRLLFEMGADVVILSDIAPSSQEFIEAFDLLDAKEILVFPNSANSILTSMQAASLHKGGRITVLNSRSLPECYAALSVLDFDGAAADAISSANETLSNMHTIAIYHAIKDIRFEKRKIEQNQFFALVDKELKEIGSTLEEVALSVVCDTLKDDEYNILTIFYGKDIADEYIQYLQDKIRQFNDELEVVSISSSETSYSLILSFE